MAQAKRFSSTTRPVNSYYPFHSLPKIYTTSLPPFLASVRLRFPGGGRLIFSVFCLKHCVFTPLSIPIKKAYLSLLLQLRRQFFTWTRSLHAVSHQTCVTPFYTFRALYVAFSLNCCKQATVDPLIAHFAIWQTFAHRQAAALVRRVSNSRYNYCGLLGSERIRLPVDCCLAHK